MLLSFLYARIFSRCSTSQCKQVRQQLKMEGRSAMSLASFYEHYLMCTAGFGQTYADSFIDIFSIADMIHKLCKYVNHYICPLIG